MCGICISKINYSSKKYNIFKILQQIEDNIHLKDLKSSLIKARLLKSNITFIELIQRKNKNYEDKLNNIVLKLKREFLKKVDQNDSITDLIWVIESEILFKCKRIIDFLDKNKIPISKKSIIFTRYLLYCLESINYLESRGRDSFGISINSIFPRKVQLNKKQFFSNKNEFSLKQLKIKNGRYLISLNFKYAERIGYSGENTKKILDKIISSKIIKNFKFDEILNTDFIAHTRWASVGKVNLSNAHPIINESKNNINLSFMNGDILNYRDIISELKKDKKYNFSDKNCTNDLQPISSLIFSKHKNINKVLNGSYVLINYNSNNPYNISIYKKGSQGLYFSSDNDGNLNFASDAYGLVNKSNKFIKIIEDGKYLVNKNFLNKFKISNYNKTDLMTKDLSKKGYKRFFLKEIDDTEIFIKRTINNYIDFTNKDFKNLKNIFNETFYKKLKAKKIRNIIFTGMGSCYSAGVGISKYLSQRFNDIGYRNIKVEATVASEGSGFYLSDNMDDTIIVVLAQSGTTIDTNVFAKMSKERGAYTLALVNKKQGDVTFIVEKSLYLGNGRDVELSVPSTKTYTCHLIMGYILSEKIISEVRNSKPNREFIKLMGNLVNSNLIRNKFKGFNDKISNFKIDIFNYINWIVVYDDSINSYAALEFRIKISECCYKSIPYVHISNLNLGKFRNTLIFYLGDNRLNNKNNHKSNFTISIGGKVKKNNFNKNFNIILKEEKIVYLTIESALALQLMAYRLSELIDNESFNALKFKNVHKFNKISKFLIDKIDINNFKNYSKSRQKILISEKLKRPIDAIKHQAKTVTVGATRSLNTFNENFFEETNYDVIGKKISFDNKIINLKDSTRIIGDADNNVYKYFFGNLIEYYNHIYKSKKYYKISTTNIFFNNKDYKYTNIIFKNKRLLVKNKSKINFNKKFNTSHDIITSFLPNDKISRRNEFNFIKAKNIIIENKSEYMMNLSEIINKFNNIKFLGSGINYLVAKKYALFFSQKFNKTIAFDVIENHKHIDISSESLLLVFASNIKRSGFQSDVYSEIEKFIAHENKPIIFTNKDNNIFDSILPNDNFFKRRIIKLPRVNEIYSFSIFEFLFDNFIS